MFGLNQENFLFIILPLVLLGLIIFLNFAKSIAKPLFKSDEKLQKSIKETIHELNIPVSTIQMNTQLLQKNINDEKSKKRLNRIQEATNNLLNLYENMEYDIKKEIDEVEKTEFFLDETIKNSIDKFEDIKKDTKIEIDITPVKVKTDINGFEKIIDNLISNAIKYNRNNVPYIKISYKNGILSFFNTGEKIDTKNLFMIFDKYFQESKDNNGFGLGLSIVKEFCDKHKIPITIDVLDNGNRFNLNIKNVILK